MPETRLANVRAVYTPEDVAHAATRDPAGEAKTPAVVASPR